MNRRLSPLQFLVLTFGLLSPFGCTVTAQVPPPPDLLVEIDSLGWLDPSPSDPTVEVLRSRPAVLALDPLSDFSLDSTIQLNLFEDVSLTAVLNSSTARYSGYTDVPIGEVWTGSIVGAFEGSIILITEPGICHASIFVPGFGQFDVQPVFGGSGIHAVRELQSLGWECGALPMVDDALPDEPNQFQPQGGADGAGAFGPESGGGASCDDGSIIDIIVLYTTAAKNELGEETLHRIIDSKIAHINVVYTNSLVNTAGNPTRMRLVYKGEATNYNEAFPAGQNLNALAQLWDGKVDEALPLRNALRADLVSLWVASQDPTGIGFAFGPFTACWAAGGGVIAHETGHNFGAAHSRPEYSTCEGNCECQHGYFKYSFGYCFGAGDIMCSGAGGVHYANPDVWVNGVQTGQPEFLPNGEFNCNSADVAKTIINTKPLVAKFRSSHDPTNTTSRASIAKNGGGADNNSLRASISERGQWIAFASDAANLVAENNNGVTNVFVRDIEDNVTKAASQNSQGALGNAASGNHSISGNGRYVAYDSDASNLLTAPLQDNGVWSDVFVRGFKVPSPPDDPIGDHDTKRLSESAKAVPGNNNSYAPSISSTGRFVVFESDATNLGFPTEILEFRDIYLRDRDLDNNGFFDTPNPIGQIIYVDTTRVTNSVISGDEANGSSFAPAISADGEWIAFESEASNLVPFGVDTNGVRDIFVRHRTGGPTKRVSLAAGVGQSNGASRNASISKTGRYIVFESDATNLIHPVQDTNGKTDAFIYDRDTDNDNVFDEIGFTSTTRISVNGLNGEANDHSYDAYIAADGRYVVFSSDATNLDTLPNAGPAVYMRDLLLNTTVRVSVNKSGNAANGPSLRPAISDDGRYISFDSAATNLDGPATPVHQNIYVRDRGPQLIGDLNGDKLVTCTDLRILLQNLSPSQPCHAADLDHDGDVDGADRSILLGNCVDCDPQQCP